MDELKHMRFLVIEDSPDTARMIAALLERRFNATVDVAPTCAAARAALDHNIYDVATLDYQLPDCSGLDMLDEITARDTHPPVIMITGHGDEELAYLSFRMGASGYAAKDRKLSILLPDAVEWAIADARHKRQRTGGAEDGRLEGLVQAAHSMSRDLRLELDSILSAGQKVEKAGGGCDPETAARLTKCAASIEKSLMRAFGLIDKLDSLVSPGPVGEDNG